MNRQPTNQAVLETIVAVLQEASGRLHYADLCRRVADLVGCSRDTVRDLIDPRLAYYRTPHNAPFLWSRDRRHRLYFELAPRLMRSRQPAPEPMTIFFGDDQVH